MKLTTPFGLLDKETQDALRAWPHGCEVYNFREAWLEVNNPSWVDAHTYRARPAPAVPDSIDWTHVAPEWKFMARDESGDVWLCDEIPSICVNAWGGAPNGIRANAFASYKRGTISWQDSLMERPA